VEVRVVRRNLVGVVLISFLVTVGFGAANLIVPYYILALKGELRELPEKLGAIHAERAVVEIGAMASAFMATRALVAAGSGWLADRFGRKPLIVAGMGLYVILGVLYAATTSPWQLVALRAVQGVASALVWPVAEALLVDSVAPELRTRALSIYIMLTNAGQVVGPAVGSVAYELSKKLLEGHSVVEVFRAPFIIITVFTLPGLAIALLLRETLRSPATAAEKAMEAVATRLRELPGAVKRALLAFYASGLLNGLAVGIVSSVMIVYVIDYIAKDPTRVGAAMSIAGLAGLAAAYPAAHIADRLSETARKNMLLATFTVARLFLAIVGFVRSYLLFILVASILNIAMNISIPLLRSIQAAMVPPRLRGRVFGLQQAFFNLGMVVGPLIGAYIYKAYYATRIVDGITGAQAAFILSAALGMVGVGLIAAYYKPARIAVEWSHLVDRQTRR
jgi:MFS family permease